MRNQSFRRKQRKYWRDTVAHDSAINWSANLKFIKKKLEYNIGYWRYVQRHVGWQEDVNRMKIAISLIKTATTDWPDIKDKHINLRTAHRYTHEQPIDTLTNMTMEVTYTSYILCDNNNICLEGSNNICKFASYTDLLKMEIVRLNRIKAMLAESGRQGKWLAQQLGKAPTTVSMSPRGVPKPFSRI